MRRVGDKMIPDGKPWNGFRETPQGTRVHWKGNGGSTYWLASDISSPTVFTAPQEIEPEAVGGSVIDEA